MFKQYYKPYYKHKYIIVVTMGDMYNIINVIHVTGNWIDKEDKCYLLT